MVFQSGELWILYQWRWRAKTVLSTPFLCSYLLIEQGYMSNINSIDWHFYIQTKVESSKEELQSTKLQSKFNLFDMWTFALRGVSPKFCWAEWLTGECASDEIYECPLSDWHQSTGLYIKNQANLAALNKQNLIIRMCKWPKWMPPISQKSRAN